jgi:hypothetical protein
MLIKAKIRMGHKDKEGGEHFEYLPGLVNKDHIQSVVQAPNMPGTLLLITTSGNNLLVRGELDSFGKGK